MSEGETQSRCALDLFREHGGLGELEDVVNMHGLHNYCGCIWCTVNYGLGSCEQKYLSAGVTLVSYITTSNYAPINDKPHPPHLGRGGGIVH